MRVYDLIIAAVLMVVLVSSAGAFSMPGLLGRPVVPQMFQTATPQLPAQTITPADVAAQTANEIFSVRVSGNIYYDKLPVQGAEVTIYHNGRKVGQTTAGDIYMFEVPGVRVGDTIRVDATYEGFTGTASEVVKFKSVSLNVQIKSGRSFIRNALDMLPTKDDISQAQQQPAQQQQQPAQQQQQTSTPSGSSSTTSTADANQLTSQIFGDTANQLGRTAGQSSNAVLNPATATTPLDTGSGMSLADIQKTINAGGFSGLII
jgi:biotin carboxyl carrier protein